MELLGYWTIIRKHLLLILLLSIIGTAGAVYYNAQLPPQYRTTTTLFLNPAAVNPLLPTQSTKTVQSVANTYIEFIRTRTFAGLVTQQSGLPLTVEQIQLMLKTEYVPDTQFFRIIATSDNPQAAQIVANTAAQVLIAENSARQQAEQQQIQSQVKQNPEVQNLIDLRDALKSALANHTDRITSLQEQVSGMELRSPSERNEDRLTSMRAELIAEQNARAQALTSLAEAQSTIVAQGGPNTSTPPDTAVIVDPAPLPEPLPSQLVAQGLRALLLSMALGIGIAFVLEYLDFTIKTPEALETAYGQPALGVIALASLKRPRTGPHPGYQLTASTPHSPVAESFRALRTNIETAGPLGSIRSLLITSAGPGEGKSFVAANLAVSLAQYGNRVILVDADLRKPNLHTAFDLPREPGFTNLLIEQEQDLGTLKRQLNTIYERADNREVLQQHTASLNGEAIGIPLKHVRQMLTLVQGDDPELVGLVGEVRQAINQQDDIASYLQPTNIKNLLVLTAGKFTPRPTDLLGSPKAAQVMEQLEAYADIVIYDSAPAGTVTDAVVMASQVDGIVQVVRAGQMRIDMVRYCKAALTQVNMHILGPVLNQVRQADLGYYSYYYEGYDYEHDPVKKPSIFSRLLPKRR